jgi:hypothetical protein
MGNNQVLLSGVSLVPAAGGPAAAVLLTVGAAAGATCLLKIAALAPAIVQRKAVRASKCMICARDS